MIGGLLGAISGAAKAIEAEVCDTLPQELSSSEAFSPVAQPTEHAKSAKITLVLPVLSANLYWQPVRIGQRITIVPTSRAKAYKRQVAFLAMAAGVRKPMDGRLAMTIGFYPHRPKDWAKRSRLRPDDWADTVQAVDLGNVEKVLSDALNNVTWFDDKQLHDIHLRRHDPDEHGERVVVTICPIVIERKHEGLL